MCGSTSPNSRWRLAPPGWMRLPASWDNCPRICAQGGLVVLEIGYDQGPAVLALLDQYLPQAHAVDLRQDYQGHDRMVTFPEL